MQPPISWTQCPDGRIAVSKADLPRTTHGSFPSTVVQVDPVPPSPEPLFVREVSDIQCVLPWLGLADTVSKRLHVPVEWILGMVYAESRGDPKAEAPDGGWGLMQITHPSFKSGLTKEQVFDPETNLLIGAGIIARHAARGAGLPVLASCYNAGGRALGVAHRSAGPWGMRETPGHISRVVAACNALFRIIKEGTCLPA